MSQIPEVRILPVKEYMKGEKQSIASRFIFTFLWRVGGCTLYQAVVLGSGPILPPMSVSRLSDGTWRLSALNAPSG